MPFCKAVHEANAHRVNGSFDHLGSALLTSFDGGTQGFQGFHHLSLLFLQFAKLHSQFVDRDGFVVFLSVSQPSRRLALRRWSTRMTAVHSFKMLHNAF